MPQSLLSRTLSRRALLKSTVGTGTLALAAPFLADAASANEIDFKTWVGTLRKDALAAGIKPATLDSALAGIAPIPRVLELDKYQPERTQTFAEYMAKVINQARIDTARQRLVENRPLLEEISRKFGVQPKFIVALWGLESDFGRIQGSFHIIPALATLAYDGRRSGFFRTELLNALKIIDQGHITAEKMQGSWAGAMGQCQFMPSSFLSYAVDYDGDGRRDIWNTKADVFASIANYLGKRGWKGDQTWGREVTVPASLEKGVVGLEMRKPWSYWRAAGLRFKGGSPGQPAERLDEMAAREGDASLIQPGGAGGPSFLVLENFRTIMKWNNSQFFATSVGSLADTMEGR